MLPVGRAKTALAILALSCLSACSSSCAKKPAASAGPAPGAKEVALFVTADLRGYLGPCGCSENMRGGLPRAGHQIADARREGLPTALIDAGDSLFRHRSPPEALWPQEERKAKAIAEAFTRMGLVAKALGELDATRGAEHRRALGLPELAAGAGRAVSVGGQPVGVAAGETAEQLKAGAKAARDGGARFVIGLVHATLEATQRLAQESGLGLDLLVVAHADHELQNDDNRLVRGAVPVAQVQSKGRSLIRVDVRFGGDGRFELAKGRGDHERELFALDQRIELLRAQVNEPGLNPERQALQKKKLEELLLRREALAIERPSFPAGKNAFTVRFLPLETTVPNDKAIEEVVAAYDKDVGQLNLAWARAHGKECPEPGKEEAAYMGSGSCRQCHEEAFPLFEASKHAHAYATLEEKHKQFHLDCVSCHVTGWQQPGGVCRIDAVAGRTDVGCEMCHGPGSLHVNEPGEAHIRLRADEQLCVSCHDRENSPHFEFQKYLAKILGPGHGAPAAEKK